MAEFSTVSASSFDPSALAAQLTEKSGDGWSVVSIVPTGGDITAFLTRSDASTAHPADHIAADEASESDPQSSWAPDRGSDRASEPVAEPAGWASAPDPAPARDPEPAYQPTVASPVYTPAPARAATPSVPAGWYADPAGRFELRYWDGGAWTEHVSRAGQQFTDPPVA